MKTLVNSLKCRRAAWALALCVCTIFIAASSFTFSQISFEKIWEADFTKPAKLIKDPCFSMDGKYLYFAGAGTILKYDAGTGNFLSSFDRSAFPNMHGTESLSISPKGTYLMSHDGSTGLYLWNTKTEKAVRFIYQTGAGLVMTPDERYHIYEIAESYIPNTPPGSENSNIYIYDLLLDSIIKKIPAWGHNSLLALSSDGKYLATVAYKNESKSTSLDSVKPRQKVLLWDTETWIPEEIDDINKDNGARLEVGFNLMFSPDNKYLAWTYPFQTWEQSRAKIFNIKNKNIYSMSDSSRICYNTIFLSNIPIYGFCYPSIEFFDFITDSLRGILDYPIYQWTTYGNGNIIFGYSFNNGALFKMKPTSVSDNSPETMFTASYQEGEIQVRFIRSLNSPLVLKIINLNGKELYKTEKMIMEASIIRVPIDLPSGFYIVKIETSSKEYSAKLEVTR